MHFTQVQSFTLSLASIDVTNSFVTYLTLEGCHKSINVKKMCQLNKARSACVSSGESQGENLELFVFS